MMLFVFDTADGLTTNTPVAAYEHAFATKVQIVDGLVVALCGRPILAIVADKNHKTTRHTTRQFVTWHRKKNRINALFVRNGT